MKIVFMGTPIYAASILEDLISSKHDIVGILTKPDSPHGRSKKLISSPVKQVALNHNIPLFQPATLKNNDEITNALKTLDAEVGVVVAYGLILPEFILSSFPLGCLNVHPSLLPKYRGSSPVSTCLLNGDTVTGISIIKLDSGIDSGPILAQKKVPIEKKEKCGPLTNRLFNISSLILINAINKIENGDMTLKEQYEKEATYTKKLEETDGLINWKNSANKISNMVRAYDPWPGAYTVLNNKKLRVIESEVMLNTEFVQPVIPGEVLVNKDIIVGTGNGVIKLMKVQPEGKSIMSAKDFSNGNIKFHKSILGST